MEVEVEVVVVPAPPSGKPTCRATYHNSLLLATHIHPQIHVNKGLTLSRPTFLNTGADNIGET